MTLSETAPSQSRSAQHVSAPTVIVVPCFDEERRLDRHAFLSFLQTTSSVDFLFVDDGSRDGTAALLGALVVEAPGRLELLKLERNGGKAEAVRRGVLHAMTRGKSLSAIGFWDADLATPLDAVPRFAEILRDRPAIEMVFGARVNLLGRMVRRRLVRHWIGRIFATVASRMLDLGIYDTQCGAKIFRVTPSLAELFAEPFLSRWIFDVEILARLVAARRGTPRPQPEDVIYELPLLEWFDVKGSKLKSRDFMTVAADLWRIRRRYLRGAARRARPEVEA